MVSYLTKKCILVLNQIKIYNPDIDQEVSMDKIFKAIEISEVDGHYERNIIEKNIIDLPQGDILIHVKYSSLNYKDALSASGNKGVTRNYPHTPGIDAAGIVVRTNTDKFKIGDEVLVTGYDLGMNTSGGFSEYINVPSEWVVNLPKGLSLKDSMAYGTAGFTAALSVNKLITGGVKPEDGEILVTGATGGVGSVAITLLSHLGYEVIAATGKIEERDALIAIGAKDIINRNNSLVLQQPNR
jgi:putative YhdH/YhfP family quinone oxidoreductase